MSETQDFAVTSSWTGDLPVSQAKPAPTNPHAPAARLVTVPVTVLAVLAVLGWSLARAFDFMALGPVRDVHQALSPLMFLDVVAPNQWQVDGPVLVAFVAALALAAIAYTPLRLALPVTLPVTAVLAIALAVAVRGVLDDPTGLLPALVVAVVLVGLAVVGARRLASTAAPSAPRLAPIWTVAAIATLAVPIAIGRAVSGQTPRWYAKTPEQLARLLEMPNTWNLFAVGTCVLIAVGAAGRLLPPYKGRSVRMPIVLLVAAVVVGFGYFLPKV